MDTMNIRTAKGASESTEQPDVNVLSFSFVWFIGRSLTNLVRTRSQSWNIPTMNKDIVKSSRLMRISVLLQLTH